MNECLENAKKNLNIQAINLKRSQVVVSDDVEFTSLNREAALAQTFRAVERVKEVVLTDADDNEFFDYRFTYAAAIRLIFSSEEEESGDDNYKPIVEISTVFDAKYFSKKKLTEDDLKAFAADNVGYHVWPYWREYVQSTCARIALSPGLEVPVYIISQKDELRED
jgi:hypothetical protein